MNQLIIQAPASHALTLATQQRLDAASGALALIQEAHTLAFFRAHPALFLGCLQTHYPLSGAELAGFAPVGLEAPERQPRAGLDA